MSSQTSCRSGKRGFHFTSLLTLALLWVGLSCNEGIAAPRQAANKDTATQRKARSAPKDLNLTPLKAAKLQPLPKGTQRLEIFLLMGQSNMKGRGVMPEQPLHDPRILMMHKQTDGIFLARHPLHLVGAPDTFQGADNAGVGPGLAFAQAIAEAQPDTTILLIPCAVGGTAISKWEKGQRLYDETIRRAQLALKLGPQGKTRIAGALWLQGEADSSTEERIAAYPDKLNALVDLLRTDLKIPNLPFIACTIGEMRPDSTGRRAINEILMSLPQRRPHTACIDGRAFAQSIGDQVHFDTPTQNQHGHLYAQAYLKLVK